ncbi:hypothetical protein PPERSA_03761 [Pseudocohnilembus persalinus]|uniref:Uncharacterized protein n=1 Tax=Pseudocohnilembus persalinus TaxID=266149 RepID=A0A0V0QBM2_PSEPJ|nr:hypothetical protein PPERSA_03761 [Pseudocohnilembus persalinus]|eukprot:KRW99586.1 hypothetical protein PPERSA_03761 [Pseudocohnilembus persalinus]
MKEREQKQNQMHEQIQQALENMSQESIEQLKKSQLEEKINELEKENQKIKDQLKLTENYNDNNISTIAQYQEQIRKNNEDYDKKFQQLELQLKQQYDNKCKQLQQENDNLKFEFQNERKLNQKEIENQLENLKLMHEHEKNLLNIKINGLNNEKKVFSSSNEQNLILFEELKQRHKEDIQEEKNKAQKLLEACNKVKEDYNKRNAIVIQEILHKENRIKKLTTQLHKKQKGSDFLNCQTQNTNE